MKTIKAKKATINGKPMLLLSGDPKSIEAMREQVARALFLTREHGDDFTWEFAKKMHDKHPETIGHSVVRNCRNDADSVLASLGLTPTTKEDKK